MSLLLIVLVIGVFIRRMVVGIPTKTKFEFPHNRTLSDPNSGKYSN